MGGGGGCFGFVFISSLSPRRGSTSVLSLRRLKIFGD